MAGAKELLKCVWWRLTSWRSSYGRIDRRRIRR